MKDKVTRQLTFEEFKFIRKCMKAVSEAVDKFIESSDFENKHKTLVTLNVTFHDGNKFPTSEYPEISKHDESVMEEYLEDSWKNLYDDDEDEDDEDPIDPLTHDINIANEFFSGFKKDNEDDGEEDDETENKDTKKENYN